MSRLSGCQPNSLIEAIHYRLPYFSGGAFEGNASNGTLLLDKVVNDFLRAGGWASIILCIALALSVCTCFYCCCMCCVCCIKGRQKPAVLKVLLGVISGAILLVGVIIMFVSFWAESSLHGAITGEATNIVNFTAYYTDPLAAEIIKSVVLQIEAKRHRVFIGYLVILFLFLLVILAVVALAPVCKSGIGVIVAVVILGFFTVFNSILVASVFAVIVVYADVCIGLFNLDVGVDICNVSASVPPEIVHYVADWVSYLDVFCNKSVNYGFTLFILSAILVVLFVLIQIFGFAYGASFSGKKRDTVTVRVSELWNDDAIEDGQPSVAAYHPSYTSEDEVPLMNVVED